MKGRWNVEKSNPAVLSTVIVFGVAGIAFGLSSTSHSGTPTDVYMTTDPDVCHGDRIGTEDVTLLPTTVEIGQQSHVLVYFASMWSGFELDSTLVQRVEIFDGNGFAEVSPGFSVSPGQVHDSGTIMWTFHDVDPGTYTVQGVFALFPEHGRSSHMVVVQTCRTVR